MRKSFCFFAALLLVSAFIGSATGKIVAALLPPDTRGHDFFSAALAPSLGPLSADLILFQFSFTLCLHLNLTGLLGMIIATIYFIRRG